jgi:hypothetical protein
VCEAVNSAPLVLRACLNRTTDVVTLSWKPPNDACGSFTKYSIYGSEDNGPFLKIEDIADITIQEYPHSLVVGKINWRYYITVHHLCDGIDSATSNTVLIDNTRPAIILLDSVSYDLTTQDIIAGWSPNPSLDNAGYILYEALSNTSGDSIGSTTNFYINISNLRSGNFPVAIASYDSCNLISLFTSNQQPVLLRGGIDTCTRSISLNWLQYQGWTTLDSQVLFISTNGSSFIRDTAFTSNTKSFTYKRLTLGDTLEFYIRSYTSNGSISSSSSKIKFSTRKLIIPSHLYLNYVTVDNNLNFKSTISLSWDSDKLQDTKEFIVKRKVDNGTYTIFTSLMKTVNENTYYLNDLNANANLSIYTYKINTVDKCDDTSLTSNESNNILLTIEPTSSHNPYIGWEQGVLDYELQYSKDRSTWNTLDISDQLLLSTNTDSTGCYRLIATENINSFNSVAKSQSNVRCRYDSLNYYVTTAINPLSSNNRFIIKGRGIDYDKSTYQIYNRWGQLIQDANIREPWYAEYLNSPVQSGTYIYIVKMFGVLGEYKTESGTINVIR